MIEGILDSCNKVGMNFSGLKNIKTLLEKQVHNKLHTGVQLHVSRKGKTVMNIALGETRPGIPMELNSILLMWSSGKPWTSVAIAQLWEKDKLDFNQKVRDFIPEFKNGKESCSIRHLLTHTSGFPMLDYPKWLTASWNEIIHDACEMKAEYQPGTQCGYHPRISWMILGEIIQRIDGRKIEEYLREEIFMPLGMDSTYLGMTSKRAASLGKRLALKDSTYPSEQIHLWVNDFEGRIFPGSTGFSTAFDMGKFYRALWNGGEWERNRIINKRTVDYITEIHRKGVFDKTLLSSGSWGLGFGLGKYNCLFSSNKTYGHGGRSSCTNFCDPQLDLIVNFNSNTMLPTEQHFARRKELMARIYEACRYRF
ncbi:MAG: beta-lactamase family protein [Candidatus Lokiarchaeota archaeon]|nr:beta-lactamase family protein [Candidatus Lokiarchaeota archaeon]